MERRALGPLGEVGDSMGRSSWFVQVIIFIPSSVKDKVFLFVCDDFQDHCSDTSFLYTYARSNQMPEQLI